MLVFFLGIHSSLQADYKVVLNDGTVVAAQSKPVSMDGQWIIRTSDNRTLVVPISQVNLPATVTANQPASPIQQPQVSNAPAQQYRENPTPRQKIVVQKEASSSSNVFRNNDVIEMHKLGLSPELILAKIKSSPHEFDTSIAAMKELQAEGIQDSIIVAMVPLPSSSSPMTPQTNRPPANKQEAKGQIAARDATPGCEKNITFGVAEAGQISYRIPKFAEKWVNKNQRKYPGLCFSQSPNPNSTNYLFVFASSQSAFNGLYPVVRTNTTTSKDPVSGSGTITDYQGGRWGYTFDGTVTTTTTTTTHENLPYTDTTTTLYLNTYQQEGTLISQRYRNITTRQGGDGANTLGYNLGSLLFSIHIKERLLKDGIQDVAK